MTQTDAAYELPPRAGAPRPRYRLTRRGKVVFTLLPLLVLAFIWLLTSGGGSVQIVELENGAVIGPNQATVSIRLAGETDPADVTVTVDEQEHPFTQSAPDNFVVDLSTLADGEHRLSVMVDRNFPFRALRAAREFVLDTTPPAIEVLSPTEPVPINAEVTVAARVPEEVASLAIDGEPVTPDESGTISKTYPEPPDAAVVITATDAVGNTASQTVSVELALAGAPGAPPMMGVHATGWTWATPELKDPIMEMIDAGLINTVELDLKDEGGDVWYDTGVELAHEIGAVTELYDLEQAVEELHAKGVRVIGRIVNFRDPRMANYAIENGNMDWVIQNPDGSAYGQYGGFTNPFNPEVREYNMALAEEAARLGVDDIMYDYVRRPDTLQELVYPGQDGEEEDAIVSFLAESRERVHGAGARMAAAVFGIAATRPHEVAQDIPRMAAEVDYIAPMIYPSHWGPGEYGVDNPNAQPYDITYRSLVDFVQQVEGTDAHIVAWVQDFSLGIEYGEAEVRAQIQAARDAGVEHILLWDAATTYTRSALDPIGN